MGAPVCWDVRRKLEPWADPSAWQSASSSEGGRRVRRGEWRALRALRGDEYPILWIRDKRHARAARKSPERGRAYHVVAIQKIGSRHRLVA
jgi:hypothetical protein